MMEKWLCIFLGGGLGSLGRYCFTLLSQHWLNNVPLPWGTLVVNVLGSFAIGVLAQRFMLQPVAESTRLFWMVGVLGGFTTFSSFSLDVWSLEKQSGSVWALVYVVLSVGLSLMACLFGLRFKGL